MSSDNDAARSFAEQASSSKPFSMATLDDVLASMPNTRKRIGSSTSRLRKALEVFARYTIVIEAIVQTSETSSNIWGSIRTLLQFIDYKEKYFEFMIQVFGQINAELFPSIILEQYQRIFSDHSAIKDLLNKIWMLLSKFYTSALSVLTGRKELENLLLHRWTVVQMHLRGLLRDLSQSKSLLESHAAEVEMEQNKKSRDESYLLQNHQLEMLRQQLAMSTEAERKRKLDAIIEMIAPASVDVDQWGSTRVWRQYPQFGDWLFNHPMTIGWLDSINGKGKYLHLKAVPGAGKIILTSKIVAAAQAKTPRATIFFYFKQKDPSRNSLLAALKGLLVQLIETTSMPVDDIYSMLSENGGLALRSLQTLMRLTEKALQFHATNWVIMDGIDECSAKERKRIVTWALGLSNIPNLSDIRVLLVSQDEGNLRSLLIGIPSISLMEQSGHVAEIGRFASRKARKLRDKFDLSEQNEIEISDKALRNANGTFIYVKLLFKYLKNQESRAQLHREISERKFPAGMYELVQKLESVQAFSGHGIMSIDLNSANRCLIETVASVQRNQRGDPQTHRLTARRKIPQSCLTCHLLNFKEQSLTIRLDELMYSSISCHVCHTLCKAIILLDHNWLKKAHSSSALNIERSQGTLCFQVQAVESQPSFSEGGKGSHWGFPMILHIFSNIVQEQVWSGLQVHQPIYSYSGSEECIRKMGEWLSACENEHLRCSRAPRALKNDASGIMTAERVIDLGDLDNVDPRLVSTGPSVLRWTALSYSWGGRNSFITTKANFGEREQTIPWVSIPATFRDAMTLTHRLGIRYIWIDALCIIQDSPEDWLAEAEKMGTIYQDARFVIAADWAPSCDSGIFSERTRQSLPIDIDLNEYETSHARQKIFVEEGSSQDFTSNHPEPSEWHTGAFFRHSVLESNSRALNKRWLNPALRRAWCFERGYSRRGYFTLQLRSSYGSARVRLIANAGFEKSSGNTLKQKLDNTLELLASSGHAELDNTLELLASSGHAELHSLNAKASKMWWNLVIEYSWCNLTFRADRLPAISAMARLFSTLGKYWEGMWRQELPLSLLWREEVLEDSDVQPPRENEKPTAPSWSWASALYPVQEPDWNHDEINAEVVDAHSLSSSDPKTYGQISNRSFCLRGPVLSGILRYMTNSWFKKPMLQLKIVLDDGTTVLGMDFESSKLRFQADRWLNFDETQGAVTEIEVTCLAIKSVISA